MIYIYSFMFYFFSQKIKCVGILRFIWANTVYVKKTLKKKAIERQTFDIKLYKVKYEIIYKCVNVHIRSILHVKILHVK